VTWKILFAISIGKDRRFKHRKYQNLWMNNKVRGNQKMQFVCVSSTSAEKFLISQGSVATCLRWGG